MATSFTFVLSTRLNDLFFPQIQRALQLQIEKQGKCIQMMLEQQKKTEEERSKTKVSTPDEASLLPSKAMLPSHGDDQSKSSENDNEGKLLGCGDAGISAEQTQNLDKKQKSPDRKTSEDSDQDVSNPPLKRAKADESPKSS